MHLSIADDRLRIDLNGWERIWAFFFNQTLEISLNHIQRVSTEKLEVNWQDTRLPGTLIPKVVKAGTYYTEAGREFWYATRSDNFLVLELEQEFYKKIVLTLDENQAWAERINHQRREVVPPLS